MFRQPGVEWIAANQALPKLSRPFPRRIEGDPRTIRPPICPGNEKGLRLARATPRMSFLSEGQQFIPDT